MRLIDADAAIEQIDDIFAIAEDKELLPAGIIKAIVRNMLHLEAITPTIEAEPKGKDINVHTIEAEPVRQGKWLPHPTERDYDVCSVCGTGTLKRTHGYQDGGFWDAEEVYKYCPHCGAKMDKEA